MGYLLFFYTSYRPYFSSHALLRSRLYSIVPSVGRFFTPLPLVEAFNIFDAKYKLSQRRFVSISFNEIRKILNLAQLIAMKGNLRLITFDGDQTLYSVFLFLSVCFSLFSPFPLFFYRMDNPSMTTDSLT